MKPRPEIEHIGIYGATCTGKSTLARTLSRGNRERRQLIYNPTMHPANWNDGWRPDNRMFLPPGICNPSFIAEQTDDPLIFTDKALSVEQTDIFIDEGADVLFLSNREAHAMVTKGRHDGNRIILCSQRPHQIAPNAREQCSILYIFRLGKTDLENVLAGAGFNVRQLPCAPPKRTGECITVDCISGEVKSGFVPVSEFTACVK